MKSNLEIKGKKLICTLRCSIRCDFPFRGFRIRVTTRRYDGGSHVLERFRSPTIADANFLRAHDHARCPANRYVTHKRASAAFSGRDYRDYYRAEYFSRARITHAARNGGGRTRGTRLLRVE